MNLQVLVVGMHRSGTSVLTRLVNLMGCHVGDDSELLPAKPDNPRGFWERKDVYRLNKEIFAAARTSWSTALGAIGPDQVSPQEAAGFRVLVGEIVATLDRRGPWVVKDPRLALVLPFWTPLLTRPVAVVPHRSPAQVAESLERRDGMPLPVGVALWELYNMAALQGTRNMPRFLVGYDELVDRPVETVRRLYRQLSELGQTRLRIPSEEAVTEFVTPKLFRARGEGIDERDYLNERRSSLLRYLREPSVSSVQPSEELSSDSRALLEHFAVTRASLRSQTKGVRERTRADSGGAGSSAGESGEMQAIEASWHALQRIERRLAEARSAGERAKDSLEADAAGIGRLNEAINRLDLGRRRVATGSASRP